MSHQIHAPTIILFEESSIYGKVYRPVNECARSIASLIGVSRIPADRLADIRRMGYKVELAEREVIRFPRAKL